METKKNTDIFQNESEITKSDYKKYKIEELKRRRKSAKLESSLRTFLLIFILACFIISFVCFLVNINNIPSDKINSYVGNFFSLLALAVSLIGLAFNLNTYGRVDEVDEKIMIVITDNYTVPTIDQEYIALFNCILKKKKCKKSRLLKLLLAIYSFSCSITLSVLLSLYKENFSLFNELVNFVKNNVIFVLVSFLMIVSVIGFISACIYYIDKNE